VIGRAAGVSRLFMRLESRVPMPPKKNQQPATILQIEQIEPRIHIIRGQRVLLDSDIAALFGVTTGAVNQAVARNPERFPEDFVLRLMDEEIAELEAERVTSCITHVFTEHGIVMLSSVLRSPNAAKMSVAILRSLFAASAVVRAR